MKSVIKIIKKEPVLIISGLCAIISAFFVPPSLAYIGYIDFKVLALLFCLMAVVSGFQACGLFEVIANKLLSKCHSMKFLGLILVMLPFFTSMLITNDVALITFVPFAITLLLAIGKQDKLIYIIILQTIAANLGSMATPVGNPQSLYLYNHYKVVASDYFAIILPYVIVSLLGLLASVLLTKNEKIEVKTDENSKLSSPIKFTVYCLLFALCLLCVFHIIDYKIVLIIVIISLLIFGRNLFSKIDYSLLLTFVCVFIFSGNLGSIDTVNNALSDLMDKNSVLTSIVASQIISNVPAAVLLSQFTDNAKDLIIGTNIGGLGTIIASLASLISFKFYIKTDNAKPIKYLLIFTIVNLIGLIILITLSIII